MGGTFELSARKGKFVTVDFWATWCAPCIKEIPHMERIYSLYRDKGVEIIGIDLDGKRENLKGYIEERELGWNFSNSGDAWEDATARQYGVNSIPSVWLIYREVVLREFGLPGMELEEAVKEMIGCLNIHLETFCTGAGRLRPALFTG